MDFKKHDILIRKYIYRKKIKDENIRVESITENVFCLNFNNNLVFFINEFNDKTKIKLETNAIWFEKEIDTFFENIIEFLEIIND